MPTARTGEAVVDDRTDTPPIIGWREWVSLPDLSIPVIKAKVDTGARSSSLHAYDLEEFQKHGDRHVRFKVHPIQRNSKKVVTAEAKVLEYRNIRSSTGKTTFRPVIVTRIMLLGQSWPVELTLAGRDEMGFRMLLGREAFRGRFLVNAAKSYYGGIPAPRRRRRRRRDRPPR